MSFKSGLSKRVLNDTYPDLSDSVSEVDAEDMAKILKGADDIDDELFGFSKKSPQNLIASKKSHSFGEDKELSKKPVKKIGFADLDDSDPLGDISLSDDDFYHDKIDKSKPTGVSKQIKPDSNLMKSSSDLPSAAPVDSKDKSTKSKLIKDLFGLDNDNDGQLAVTNKLPSDKKKDDWLGIKESPKKSIQENESSSILVNKKEGNANVIKSNSKNGTGDFTSSVVKNSDQSVVKNEIRPKSELKSSIVSFDSKKTDDLFDLLDDSKPKADGKVTNKNINVGSKETDVTDDLFGSKVSANKTGQIGFPTSSVNNSTYDKNVQPKDSEVETTRPTADSASPALGQYLPSSGSGRRPGFGRRRDSIPDSSRHETDPVLGAVSKRDEVMTGSNRNASLLLNDNVNFIDTPKTASNNLLPSWLGGTEKVERENIMIPVNKAIISGATYSSKPLSSSETDKPVNKVVTTEAEIPTKKSEELSASGDVLAASTAMTNQSMAMMKQMENQISSMAHMKQQQNMVAALCDRQKQLLYVQQQNMEQLVKQQLDRQMKVDQQMRQQQEKINTLMQSLINESQTHVSSGDIIRDCDSIYVETNTPTVIPENEGIANKNTSTATSKDNNLYTELEIEIHKMKIENATLEQRLESLETVHKDELRRLEEFHKNEVSHWEAREERLKESQADLQKDYESRISRLQENEIRLVEQHNDRVDNLQKERLADLRQVGEFHRLAMEQVASVGKMLFEDTRIMESKRAIESSRPLDESQLSTRELTLLRKEKELHSLKENIEREQINLTAEKEEIMEKLDKDKRTYDEKLRQLKREQSDLKMREEEFAREQERENDLLKVQKKQIEDLRNRALSEQAKAVEERLQVTASQARLEALAKLQGGQDASSFSSFDLVQARAEVEGTLSAAREEKSRAEEEKRKLKQERMALETEQWRLQEWEQEISAKSKHVEDMIKASNLKKEEGYKALEEAKLLETKMEAQNRDFQSQLNDLNDREEKLMKEKLELAKEKAILDRRRVQLESVLPPLSPMENLTLGISNTNRNIIDPKQLIMKLKAEKDFDTLLIKT